MNRRRLLAHAGIGSVGCLAGCLGRAGTPGSAAETNPGEDDGRGSWTIDDQPCPPYDTVRDSAVCAHTVDTDAAPVSLEANPTRSTLADGAPADEITLTLVNRSTRDLTVNPYGWNIRRRSGTEWEAFWQEFTANGIQRLAPNETRSWSFLEAVETVRHEPDLEPGLYAAELGVPDPEVDDEWIGCIALVRLETR